MGIEEIFRADYGRILATLIRLLGDIDVAEEALQEAFAATGCAGARGSRRSRTRSRGTSSCRPPSWICSRLMTRRRPCPRTGSA